MTKIIKRTEIYCVLSKSQVLSLLNRFEDSDRLAKTICLNGYVIENDYKTKKGEKQVNLNVWDF